MKKLKLSKCEICETDFVVGPGCYGKCCSLDCSKIWCTEHNRKIAKEKQNIRVKQYDINPKKCKNCSTILSYTHRKKSFCNNSCAATFNNKLRCPQSEETKAKRSQAVKQFYLDRRDKICTRNQVKTCQEDKSLYHDRSDKIAAPVTIGGLYTKVYRNICYKTGMVFFSKTYRKYHPAIYKDRDHYKLLCQFSFSIKEYTEWFAYANKLIKEHGWYSPYNKKNNLTGCSRDHLYSISDGYKNKIDPKIISHPANCNIVIHPENQKKHKKSSITLDELIERIKLFDEQYKKME